MRVTVWGEGWLDLGTLVGEPPLNYANYADEARRLYPDEVHGTIAAGLREHLAGPDEVVARCLDDPDAGLDADTLGATDVLVWWSHVKEDEVPAAAIERLHARVVEEGMGVVVLHSGAQSRLFRSILASTGRTGGWRQSDDWEAVWTVAPEHEIARGLARVFVLPAEEVWSEPFDIPPPDELVFVSTFRGGEVFRSGCCFERGAGRIFYFRPGHESHPTYHHPAVRQVLANAVRWAGRAGPIEQPEPAPLPIGYDVATKELTEGWFRNP